MWDAETGKVAVPTGSPGTSFIEHFDSLVDIEQKSALSLERRRSKCAELKVLWGPFVEFLDV